MTTKKLRIFSLLLLACCTLWVTSFAQQQWSPDRTLTECPGATVSNSQTVVLEFEYPVDGVYGVDFRLDFVSLDIDHAHVADLDITLTSPAGDVIDLTSDNGGAGNAYNNTVLDDDAMTSVVMASAPFEGEFKPEEALSSFNGSSTVGTWTVTITDDFSLDNGTANCLTLQWERATVAPFECPADTVMVPITNGSCEAFVDYASLFPTTDIDTIVVNSGPADGSGLVQGMFLDADISATDEDGNTLDCQFVITAVDITAPILVCPESFAVDVNSELCDGYTPADKTELAPVQAFDNCAAALTFVVLNGGEEVDAGAGVPQGPLPVGANEICYTLTESSDDDGNGVWASSCCFTVTVNEVAPTLECPADFFPEPDGDECTYASQPGDLSPTVGDDCDFSVSYVIIDPAGDTVETGADDASGFEFGPGPYQVCYSLESSDGTGGAAALPLNAPGEDVTFSGELTTDDPTYARAFGAPPSCTLSGSGDNVFYDVFMFTIDTDGMYTFTNVNASTDGVATIYEGDFDPADACSDNRIGYDDDSGTGAGANDPLIEITLMMSAGCYTLVTSTFSDGQTGAYDWTIDVPDGAVMSTCGPMAAVTECCFTVQVSDTEAPVVVCPPDSVLFDDEDDGAENCGHTMGSTALDPTATDECGAVTITHDYAAAPSDSTLLGATFPLGETTVTFTITDGAGNTSECVIVITVENTTPPVLDCPKDWTITLDPGACEYIFNFEVSATDPCQSVSGTATESGAASCDLFDNSGAQGLVCDLFSNTPIGYARMFGLADELGVSANSPTFLIESIDFIARGSNGVTDVVLYFYGSNVPEPSFSSMDLISSQSYVPPAGAADKCVTAEVNVEIPTTYSHVLVVVETDASAFGGVLPVLSDNDSPTGPTYIDLTNCFGLGTDWQDLAAAGFPAFAGWTLPLWVDFSQQSDVAPTMQDTTGDFADFGMGDAIPIGDYTFRFTSDDGFGNVAECTFDLTVEEFPSTVTELACNDHINLSLNENCEATVTADIFLKGNGYGCYDDYEIIITDEDGNVYDNTLDASAVGIELTVMVRDPETGNVCWGTLTVEDKLGPAVICADLTVECDDEIPVAIAPELDSATIVYEGGNGEEINSALDPVEITWDVDFGRPGVTVADVNVALNITHTWVSDLTIELESPAGTTTTLWGGFCGANDNLNYIADDEGRETDQCVDYHESNERLQFPGLIPDPMFSEFDGEDPTGTWTLTITDGVGGDNGTVDFVALELSVDADEANPTDACGDVEITFEDISDTDMICSGPFIRIIERRFTATDAQGASQSCVQNIFVRRPALEDISRPRNFDDLDLPSLDCGDCTTPDCTGEPGGALCRNFQYTFKDHELPICAGSFTILRKWKVLDMCTSEILEFDQIIKVLDKDGPTLICPYNDDITDPSDADSTDNVTTVLASVFECVGTVSVDLPEIVDACGASTIADFTVELTGPAGVEIIFAGVGYLVNGMPLGFHQFTYTVTDGCGNATSCDFFIEVIDKVPPTPVCDENTEVSLSSDGTARVFAETFDDGSHDNCVDQVWFKVIRMEELCGTNNGFTGIFNSCLVCDGLNANDGDDDDTRVGVQVYFDDEVKFCCEDVGREDILVVLRVYDVDPGEGPVDPSRMVEGGDLWCHFNDCMVNIDVQDKLPPFVSCPDDLFFDCEEDLDMDALADITNPLYGLATVVGICEPTLEVSVRIDVECGEGVVTRTFSAMSNNGATSTCTQRIFLTNGDPYNITDNVCPGEPGWSNTDGVDWPCDVLITDLCVDDVLADPSATGEPILYGDVCSDLLVSYDDEVFTRDDDACLKILRTWKVLDWCQFDELTGEGIWTYVQVIKLDNTVAPEFFEGCEDIVQCDSAATGCSSFVELIVNASDDCTDTASIDYAYQIDAFYDPFTPFEVDFFGSGNDASGEFPFGTHLIRFTATDGCGNSTTCEFEFDLQDCKKPSPKCFSGLVTVIMPAVGEVEIWASDFDAGSDDNCGDVTVSFSEDINDIFRTFTCADIASPVTLPVYVTDEAGNFDFCETFIIIQDNSEVCDDSLSASIMGIAETQMEEGVEGAEITLTNETILFTQTVSTDVTGDYAFFRNPLASDYTIEAYSNDDPRNGLSTRDIVEIQKHLLGLEPFTTAYESVAADVNNSESVSALDMVELRKLLLGVYDEFPNNTSWRFIDETQTYNDIHEPWPLDEVVEIANLSTSMLDENFVSVKVGDLNNSATPNALVSTEDRTDNGALTLVAQDAAVVAGTTYNVAITADNFDAILGYQFTLNFNSGLEFAGFTAGALAVSGENFGLNRLEQGIITTSWNDAKAVTVDATEVLFTLHFQAQTEGQLSEMIQIGSQITAAESYSSLSDDLDVLINFRSENGDVAEAFEMLQNVPNPFKDETVIGFNLPEAAEVLFTVQDVNGKTVYSVEQEFAKGYNQISLDRADVKASSVVFYTIEAGDYTSTKKMILID